MEREANMYDINVLYRMTIFFRPNELPPSDERQSLELAELLLNFAFQPFLCSISHFLDNKISPQLLHKTIIVNLMFVSSVHDCKFSLLIQS